MKRREALKSIPLTAASTAVFSGSGSAAAQEKGLSVEIKEYKGGPTLFINGKPTFYFGWWVSFREFNDEEIKKYAESNDIHIYVFEGGGAWSGPGANRESHFDFSSMDRIFERLLTVDPEALFHLRINLEMNGQWWHRLHPLELEITSEGIQKVQSFASTAWREEAKDFLNAYAEHMEASGLADHVLAYQVGAGHTGEWCKRVSSMASPCGDYSEPMRKHFRNWLMKKYDNDVSMFRDAWNNSDVDFDLAEVPQPAEQLHAENYLFRNPRTEMNVIDYFTCLSELCSDLVIEYCRTVKEATNGKSLAGAFYGYVMEMVWNSAFFAEWPERWREGEYSTIQRSGHLGLSSVLESPYVDFFVSPYSYGFRGIGGDGPSMLPEESLRIRNKFYIYEEDSRLSLPNYPFSDSEKTYGRAENTAQSISILNRNFSYVATHAMGEWARPANDRTIGDYFGNIKKMGTFTLQTDHSPAADIAVLIDDESYFYESSRNNLDIPLIFHQKLQGLPRMGAPYDCYLLHDFINGRMKPYKLYIFLNPFHLDTSRVELLKSELRKDNRIALWIYGAGYIQDTPSLNNMTDLTGFGFGASKYPWSEFMYITDFKHPITRDLSQDVFWGATTMLSPHFHIEDEDAYTLGYVVYSQGTCVPGFGVKTFPEWTSIYCSAPNIPSNVLRGIAKFANVHIYNDDGDVLHVSENLIGVHTLSGGQRTFKLPARVEEIYDLVENKTVARNAAQFNTTLKPFDSYVFYTGNSALLRENSL